MTDIGRVTAALADQYAIERELGQGGMATVYLADDLKHHRQVAIKVMRPELAAAMGGDRFLREIAIAAQLQHPHILMLIDSGEADGILYYVAWPTASSGRRNCPSTRRCRSVARWPAPWRTPTTTASSTATSSRTTSCSPAATQW